MMNYLGILAHVEYEEEKIRREELMGVDLNAIWKAINGESKTNIGQKEIKNFLSPLVPEKQLDQLSKILLDKLDPTRKGYVSKESFFNEFTSKEWAT